MPTVEDLEAQMAAAVAREDFEAAARLRDEIAALTRFRRHTLDEMGIGTDQQAYQPPKGWKPPRRPDPMTRGHKPAKRKR